MDKAELAPKTVLPNAVLMGERDYAQALDIVILQFWRSNNYSR